MAMNVSQFQPSDNFNMAEFNDKISEINSGVDNEIRITNSSWQAAISNLQTEINTKAKIQTGYYVGTETYGSDNPSSLTFDFEPKIIWVSQQLTKPGGLSVSFSGVLAFGCMLSTSYTSANAFLSINSTFPSNISESFYSKLSGNTFSWYGTKDYLQLNDNGVTYFYIVLG